MLQINQIYGQEMSSKLNSLKKNEPDKLSKIYLRVMTDDEEGSFTTQGFCKVIHTLRKLNNSQTSLSEYKTLTS